MSRRTKAGGGSTKRRIAAGRHSRAKPARAVDLDSVDFGSVHWADVVPVEVELDPALVEQIHARRRLKPLTLRVGLEQIAEARRVAAETGTKYQAVLRRWLAEGASRAKAQHGQ